jgi:oligopeptide/dipeptide ABC transporter ATP-binding protein
MYAGTIVEVQTSAMLHQRPLHPYTAALLAARPSLTAQVRPVTISGSPVALADAPAGCTFAPRCAYQDSRCRLERPTLREGGVGSVACVRAHEIASQLAVVAESARG